MTQDRCNLATRAVEHMLACQEAIYPGRPLLEIHWDDCDADDRRFWVHFRRPGLTNVMQTRAPVVRDCSGLIRLLKMRALEFLEPSVYSCVWDLHSRPIMRYRQYQYRKTPTGFDCDTWQYVLSFYG